MTCAIFGELETRKQNHSLSEKKHFSGTIQPRPDYIFISNSLQEIVSYINADILNAFSTDHSPVFCFFIKRLKYTKGPGFWKFNNSLISSNDFVKEMKCSTHNTKIFIEQDVSFSNQNKWEFFKYEIRKKCVYFSNVLAQKSHKQHADLL